MNSFFGIVTPFWHNTMKEKLCACMLIKVIIIDKDMFAVISPLLGYEYKHINMSVVDDIICVNFH